MSCVVRHLTPVTCQLSLTPTATATDPPSANSPSMHRKLVCKDQKPKNIQTQKSLKRSNISHTLFNQKSPVHQEAGFPGGDRQQADNRRTSQLID